MKVFHYSKIENWNRIRSGSYWSNDIPGLGNARRLNPIGFEGSNIGCSFSLLEPLPRDWVKNKHFPYIWSDLRNITGNLLVEVDLRNIDNVFVTDWGHVQGWATEEKRKLPEKYRHNDEYEARKAYYESMVRLNKFLKDKRRLEYSLPEVIITEIVPFTNLHIPKNQPRLDDYFLKHHGFLRKELMMYASWIPELEGWVKEHEDIKKREGSFHSKER